MKLKKADMLWLATLSIWIFMLITPFTRTIFINSTEAHPYIGGFFKFFILATMGDWLGMRILKDEWIIQKGFIYKAVVWGIIGLMITLVFTVFNTGVFGAQAVGRLPFAGSYLAQAFFASAIMNLTFGPMMYIYHKFGDYLIDTYYVNQGEASVNGFVEAIDWHTMVGFSWVKTCTLIWIPLHTLVFLLPSEYRVLASAFLSILLGILVAISKKSTSEDIENTTKLIQSF